VFICKITYFPSFPQNHQTDKFTQLYSHHSSASVRIQGKHGLNMVSLSEYETNGLKYHNFVILILIRSGKFSLFLPENDGGL
jgi:hypothetical protein